MRVVFKQPTSGYPWRAYDDATNWCADHGYAAGSMQRGAPTGVLRGSARISKWRGMTKLERQALDGTITSLDGGTFRGSDCVLEISRTWSRKWRRSRVLHGVSR